MNFLHTFQPESILIQIGPITIYWYGLFIVLGMLAASVVVIKLAKKYSFSQDDLLDAMFWSILFGILGARAYHVFLELPYYLSNPWQIPQIWQGGLAIHGGIFAGLLTLYIFAKKKKVDFWLMAAISAPALALAQAIGRFGNYFNQELYGMPTSLPWGIPIEQVHRVKGFENFEFFHPTFLYESIGNLIIFALLIYIHKRFLLQKQGSKESPTTIYYLLFTIYLITYSLLRFLTEFIRIDTTPVFFGLRFPQIISLILIIFCLVFLYKKKANISPLAKE